MEKMTIYIVFMDTGTYLSKIIRIFTKKRLNHVSLAFDLELFELYSFGRKKPYNPFYGGFVREDVRGDFLRHADCAIYALEITASEYKQLVEGMIQISEKESEYRYNFLGLLGILLKLKIERKQTFFCSQFVATLLMNHVSTVHFSKPLYFITPTDILKELDLKLIYEGKFCNYLQQLSQVQTICSCSKRFAPFLGIMNSLKRKGIWLSFKS